MTDAAIIHKSKIQFRVWEIMSLHHLLKIENWKLKILLPLTGILLFFALDASAATIGKPMQSLGLVGYWSFDVGKGGAKAVDMSGRGNNGTLTNMNTTAAWVGGKIGDCPNTLSIFSG